MSYATNFATPALAQAAIANSAHAYGYLRQAGEAFKASQGKFFVSAAAVWLYMGDTEARAAAKEAWADSKDKAREYALKVFRACAAAATAGRAGDIAKVRTFAELAGLAPAKTTAPAETPAADATAPASQDAPAADGQPTPPPVSKLDALMDQFARMEALEARMRTMAMNKEASADQHRSEAMGMYKTLEALRTEMLATLSAPAA